LCNQSNTPAFREPLAERSNFDSRRINVSFAQEGSIVSSLIHWPEDRRIPIAFPVPIRGDAIAPLTRKPDLVPQYFCLGRKSRGEPLRLLSRFRVAGKHEILIFILSARCGRGEGARGGRAWKIGYVRGNSRLSSPMMILANK